MDGPLVKPNNPLVHLQFVLRANKSVLPTNISFSNSSAPFKNIFLNCNNSFKISIYGSNLFIKFYFIILNHKFQLKNPLKKILELVKMTSVSNFRSWSQQKRRKTGALPTYVGKKWVGASCPTCAPNYKFLISRRSYFLSIGY